MKIAASIALGFGFAVLVSMALIANAPGENHGNIWAPDYTITKIAFAVSWIAASVVILFPLAGWPEIFLRAMLCGSVGWGYLTVQSFYGTWFSSFVPVTMLVFCLACSGFAFRSIKTETPDRSLPHRY